MWVFTVSAPSPSRRATWVVELPSANICRISRWRLVRLWPARGRPPAAGSMNVSASAAASTARLSLSGSELLATNAFAPAAIASPTRWRSARSPWATIPSPGCALRSARIVAAPHSASLVALLGRAHVDDRDVEVADVSQKLEGARPGVGLLDLVALAQNLAYADADRGLAVYHQAS